MRTLLGFPGLAASVESTECMQEKTVYMIAVGRSRYKKGFGFG
jgi:hypothetical protein